MLVPQLAALPLAGKSCLGDSGTRASVLAGLRRTSGVTQFLASTREPTCVAKFPTLSSPAFVPAPIGLAVHPEQVAPQIGPNTDTRDSAEAAQHEKSAKYQSVHRPGCLLSSTHYFPKYLAHDPTNLFAYSTPLRPSRNLRWMLSRPSAVTAMCSSIVPTLYR